MKKKLTWILFLLLALTVLLSACGADQSRNAATQDAEAETSAAP